MKQKKANTHPTKMQIIKMNGNESVEEENGGIFSRTVDFKVKICFAMISKEPIFIPEHLGRIFEWFFLL